MDGGQTCFRCQIEQHPRGFLGWGNVSTLGLSLDAAKKAFPGRASVAVTGEAGLDYVLGNLEVLLREKLGITVVHSSNGGFAGYGPGLWGPGHDPFTHQVLGLTRWICRRLSARLPHRAGERARRGHPGPAEGARRQ